METIEKGTPQMRLGKERWLRTALEAIAREGDGKLRIDALARELNVTKGSFYHHFRDRQEFIDQVVGFWVERYNHYVIETIGQLEGPAEYRLLSLMKLVKREGLDLYDTTFRAWAAHDGRIAEKVRQVDHARYVFIRGLFDDMRFSGDELELRTRIWLVFAAASSSVSFPGDAGGIDDPFVASHEIFTRKLPE